MVKKHLKLKKNLVKMGSTHNKAIITNIEIFFPKCNNFTKDMGSRSQLTHVKSKHDRFT